MFLLLNFCINILARIDIFTPICLGACQGGLKRQHINWRYYYRQTDTPSPPYHNNPGTYYVFPLCVTAIIKVSYYSLRIGHKTINTLRKRRLFNESFQCVCPARVCQALLGIKSITEYAVIVLLVCCFVVLSELIYRWLYKVVTKLNCMAAPW